jgi:hypothetical protein
LDIAASHGHASAKKYDRRQADDKRLKRQLELAAPLWYVFAMFH